MCCNALLVPAVLLLEGKKNNSSPLTLVWIQKMKIQPCSWLPKILWPSCVGEMSAGRLQGKCACAAPALVKRLTRTESWWSCSGSPGWLIWKSGCIKAILEVQWWSEIKTNHHLTSTHLSEVPDSWKSRWVCWWSRCFWGQIHPSAGSLCCSWCRGALAEHTSPDPAPAWEGLPWPTCGSSCPVLNMKLTRQICWTRQVPANLCSSEIAKCWEEWLGQEQVQQQAFTPVSLLAPNNLLPKTSHQLKTKRTFQDCQLPSLVLLLPLTDLEAGHQPQRSLDEQVGADEGDSDRCSPTAPHPQLCAAGTEHVWQCGRIVTCMQLYRKTNFIDSSVIVLWGCVSICKTSISLFHPSPDSWIRPTATWAKSKIDVGGCVNTLVPLVDFGFLGFHLFVINFCGFTWLLHQLLNSSVQGIELSNTFEVFSKWLMLNSHLHS